MASFVRWIYLFYKFLIENSTEEVLKYPSSYQYPFYMPFYDVNSINDLISNFLLLYSKGLSIYFYLDKNKFNII